MCGIAGFIGRPKRDPNDILNALSYAQVHRGPDAEGYWLSRDLRVGFAHRRLSIVDLSVAGNQPMWSQSERYVITFNGEIYNFLTLRHELSALGHKFHSTSDTEVMLAAFDQWGVTATLTRLNGMFAAAVWDQETGTGYLFRDRFGLKPLYYQWHHGVLFFSSELSSAFAKLCDRSISRDALALFIRHGYVPTPSSIYEDIFKLPPGTLLTVSQCDSSDPAASISYYWDTQQRINGLLSNRKATCEEEICEKLDDTLRRSVRDRMIADVPLGAFLSGGIDSSLIVSYMQQVSNSQVRTFTIGFEENRFDEARFAKKVAQHLGTVHTELIVTEQDALNVVPDLPRIYGEPFADSSQIPTYLVSKLTRQYVTVALSGDGGDELFGGYNMYRRILRFSRALESVPGPLRMLASTILANRVAPEAVRMFCRDQHVSRVLSGMKTFSQEMKTDLSRDRWGPVTLAERLVRGASAGISIAPFLGCDSNNVVERSMCNDLLTYLPDDILVKVDRASMAVSLEVRAPFVDDFEIFDIAWQTPFALKMNDHGGKVILRKLLARSVPPELTERPKAGFAVPLTKWLGGVLRDWVEECVSPVRLRNEGYLQPKEVARVYKRALQGDEYYAHVLWYICQFQSWLFSAQAGAPNSSRLCYAS